MKLACIFDDKRISHFKGEGIHTYCSFLFDALLKNDDTFQMELYVYSFNMTNLIEMFGFLSKKYPGRISFIDETVLTKDKKFYTYKYYKYVLFHNFFKFINMFFKISKCSNMILKYETKMKDGYCYNINKLKKNLKQAINASDADAIYVPFITYELGKEINKPTLIMVHDIFSLPLRNLFFSINPKIDKHNNQIIHNLAQYAAKKSVFISTSSYTVNEHLLKYIPNLKKEQTKVIPFPPLIRKFDKNKIIAKEAFKLKYKIDCKYIAYPSQVRPNKNFIVILKALNELAKEDIKIKLVTTGNFSNLEQTESYIVNNHLQEYVLETGKISEEDLFMLYKYSDMVVVSTIIEGLGISGQCLEALEVGGIPVIHSKAMGVEESLESVGLSFKSADLNWFDLDDYKTLAKKIKDVIDNPKLHIEKQKHIINAYSKTLWEGVSKNYYKIIEEELSKNG